jgi:hypothetical protein
VKSLESSRVRPVWLLIAGGLGIVVLLVCISAAGLYFLVARHPSSEVGFSSTPDGIPTVVAVLCPGVGIGSFRLVRQSDGAVVFQARLKDGRPASATVSVDGDSDLNYEKTLTQELSSDERYRLDGVADNDGTHIDFVVNTFRQGDLRTGLVVRGVDSDGKGGQTQSLGEFKDTKLDC